jgi:phenylacetate-CoA ligase
MLSTTYDERRRAESLSGEALSAHQLMRLNALLKKILPQNSFYAEKLGGHLSSARLSAADGPLASLDELRSLPFTYKQELVESPHGGDLVGNLTYPRERYVRFHQTSGTHGRPLPVLDTADDWQWWLDCWQFVLDAADIQPGQGVLLAFSFGPFVGFWSAYEAAAARGCLVVPSGGMTSLARLELLRTSQATALFCTPSYALHLAEVAEAHQMDAAGLGVRTIVTAGEPGGSVPGIRRRIESLWQARVLDHAGATEVGPWGYGDAERRGLHVLETEFIAEFLAVDSGQPAADGQLAEIVLTTLGRSGAPLIRYRTGDLVRPFRTHDLTNRFVLLEGGVLGRTDDMLIIRGVNIFPSAVEEILRGFPEVVEFRLVARRQANRDSLVVEIEDRLGQPKRVAEELRVRLGLKVEVRCVPLLSLPRFEGKGKRLLDERG